MREQLKQQEILQQERLKVELEREKTRLMEQAHIKQTQALEILAKQKDADYELKLREVQKNWKINNFTC